MGEFRSSVVITRAAPIIHNQVIERWYPAWSHIYEASVEHHMRKKVSSGQAASLSHHQHVAASAARNSFLYHS